MAESEHSPWVSSVFHFTPSLSPGYVHRVISVQFMQFPVLNLFWVWSDSKQSWNLKIVWFQSILTPLSPPSPPPLPQTQLRVWLVSQRHGYVVKWARGRLWTLGEITEDLMWSGRTPWTDKIPRWGPEGIKRSLISFCPGLGSYWTASIVRVQSPTPGHPV